MNARHRNTLIMHCPEGGTQRPVMWLDSHTYLLTYAYHSQWSIGHQRTPATALCSGLFLSFWTSWSPAVSALLQCLTSNCCEAGLFLFPCWFQVRAWRVVLDAGFLRVCPIQLHFLRSICLATGSCPARSHSHTHTKISSASDSRKRRHAGKTNKQLPSGFVRETVFLCLFVLSVCSYSWSQNIPWWRL